MPKIKIPKDPKSEAAARWCVENWDQFENFIPTISGEAPVLGIWDRNSRRKLLEIDLRQFVKKRQPLTGIKKLQTELAKTVRGAKKPKRKK